MEPIPYTMGWVLYPRDDGRANLYRNGVWQHTLQRAEAERLLHDLGARTIASLRLYQWQANVGSAPF